MKKFIIISKIVISIILAISVVYIAYIIDFYIEYQYEISLEGLKILNDYELPKYLIDTNDSGFCIEPYDVGDGVITFGPGIVFPNEKDGLVAVNNRFKTSYSLENDCINLRYLFVMELEVLNDLEVYVNNFSLEHKIKFDQNEFDALILLTYNSPAILHDDEVIKMLNSKPTPDEYIQAINGYYETLDSYYDNIYTDEENDGFGNGWYNRIVDSSEVFFNNEYKYQNSLY